MRRGGTLKRDNYYRADRRSANHCRNAAATQPVDPPLPTAEQLFGRIGRAVSSKLSTAAFQLCAVAASASGLRRLLGKRYRSLSGAFTQTMISSPTATGHCSSPKTVRTDQRSGAGLSGVSWASAGAVNIAVATSIFMPIRSENPAAKRLPLFNVVVECSEFADQTMNKPQKTLNFSFT